MNVQSHFHHQTLRWQIKTEAFPSPFPLMGVVATNQYIYSNKSKPISSEIQLIKSTVYLGIEIELV